MSTSAVGGDLGDRLRALVAGAPSQGGVEGAAAVRRDRTTAGAAIAIALALTVAVVVALGRGGDDGPLAAGTLDLDGRAVLVAADGGRSELVDGRHDLVAGDRFEVVEGSGVLGLGGGATLEARAGRTGRPDTDVEVAEPVVLRAGDALLTAPTAARVEVGGTEFGLANGAARLARTTGSSVGVYAGEVGVTSGGRSLPGGVPALRQATIAARGSVPTRAEPLDYDPDAPDPWDLRFLGSAIELGAALDARSIGFTAALPPGTEVDAAYLAAALPGLADEPGFDDAVLDGGRSAGELLVGAAIADVAQDGSFGNRWEATFGFRGDGARWGLVALDRGVGRAPLLAAVDAAIDGATLLRGPSDLALAGPVADPVVLVSSTEPASVAPTEADGAPAPPAPPAAPPTIPPPGPGGGDEPGGPPAPIPPAPEPVAPVLEPLTPLVDPVEDLLGDLLGGGDESTGPTPTTPPTEAPPPVPVVGPVVGPVVDVLVGREEEPVVDAVVDALLGRPFGR